MSPGQVEAIVATMGVPCLNDRMFAPGSIESGRLVFISIFDHLVLKGDEAVGMGTVFVEGNVVVLRGRYDIHTPRGRGAHERVRAMGHRVRWSLGFNILDSHREEVAGRSLEVITRAWPIEVSPVWKPADPSTRTLLPESARMAEAADVLTAITCS